MVVKKALRVVKLESLQVDPSYQRGVKPKHKKIISDFNESALGVLLVGEREDSSLWLVDGLQRKTALEKMKWTETRCEVFASEGPEHEAEIFRLVNLGRTNLTTRESFRSMLTEGHPLAWLIKEAVESCGGKLHLDGGRPADSKGATARAVTCLSTLVRHAAVNGAEPIKFAITTAYECWPDDRMGINNRMIGGLCCWWKQKDGVIDLERLYPRLKSITPHKIMYAAAMTSLSGNTDFSNAEQIEKVYRLRRVKS